MNQSEEMILLKTLKTEIPRIFGNDLEKVLVFGSYARGEAHQDSDLDILIVLRGDVDYGTCIKKTSALISRLSLKNDIVISRTFISKDRFEHEHSPFLMNVRREGIPL